MFKGIQGFIKGKSSDKPSREGKLSPVLTAEKILSDKRRADIISRLPTHMGLNHEKFSHLVMTLIRRFAEFTQLLPETRNSYFAHNGGLLDHGLERADAALSLVRGYFLPESADNIELTEPQTLWTYAVFSAALLNGVGKVATDFIIEIFDHQEKFLRSWMPFSGSMLTQGAYYDYEFDNVHPDSFKRRSSVVLARQLMPEEGFLWISSDKDVLSIWLALLEDDQRDAGTLGPILWRADAQVINHNLNQPKVPREFGARDRGMFSPSGLPFAVGGSEKPLRVGEHQQVGMEFLRWLHSGLLTQKIKVNQSALFAVPAGMLMCPDLFKYFIREHPEFKNWLSVQNALVELGLLQVGMNGDVIQEFQKMSDSAKHMGVVLSNMHLVLPEQFHVVVPGSTESQVFTPEQLANAHQLQGDLSHIGPVNQAQQAHKFISPGGHWVSDPKTSAVDPRYTPPRGF